MKFGLFTVTDVLAHDSAPVFCSKTVLTAWRQFEQSMKNVHDPEHYRLFHVGFFDTEDRCVTGFPAKLIRDVDVAQMINDLKFADPDSESGASDPAGASVDYDEVAL